MSKQTRPLSVPLSSLLGLALKAYHWLRLGVPAPKQGEKQCKSGPVRMLFRGLTGEEELTRCHEDGH
jgi:hypothetical protein